MCPWSVSQSLGRSIEVSYRPWCMFGQRGRDSRCRSHSELAGNRLGINPGALVSGSSARCLLVYDNPSWSLPSAHQYVCTHMHVSVCVCLLVRVFVSARVFVCAVCGGVQCLHVSGRRQRSQQLSRRTLPSPQSNRRARVTLRVTVCLRTCVGPWQSRSDVGQRHRAAGRGLPSWSGSTG